MPGLIPTNNTRIPFGIRSRSGGSDALIIRGTAQRPSTNWLMKEEPEHYAFDALVRDGRTVWSGVKNPLAQKHLRNIRKGDRIFYYHTKKEKAMVGVARAATDAYDDPKDKTGKMAMVDI